MVGTLFAFCPGYLSPIVKTLYRVNKRLTWDQTAKLYDKFANIIEFRNSEAQSNVKQFPVFILMSYTDSLWSISLFLSMILQGHSHARSHNF